MSGIQLLHDETILSNTFLRRLQVPTEKGLDACCTALIELFIERYGDKIDDLIKLGETKLEDVDKFLTVEVPKEDLGVSSGKNPSRAIENLRTWLKTIHSRPYIVYEIVDKGVRKYQNLPLLKDSVVDDQGNCKIVFNDRLRFHVSSSYTMEKNFGKCSFSLLKEIKGTNIYASILYEEACSWENFYNRGNDPFFCWSVSELRKKFSFDQMDLSKDGVTCKVTPVKSMRVNNLIRNILIPACEVLEDYYKEGKTGFWLEMTTYFTGQNRPGRPPKDGFRFAIRKKPRIIVQQDTQDAVQLDIFDDYEEITNLTEIEKELKGVIYARSYIVKVMKQIGDQEMKDKQFSEKVLSKVRHIRTKYAKKGKEQWGRVLKTVLWCDFHLGDESMEKDNCQQKTSATWPDTIDEKIKAMQLSYEICDKVMRDYGLSQERTVSILENEFREHCIKHQKPLKNWKDATSLLFNLLGSDWFLTKKRYESKRNERNNEGWQAAASFLGESADI